MKERVEKLRDTAAAWIGIKVLRLDMLQNLQLVVLLFRSLGHDDLDGYMALSTIVGNEKRR